MLDSFTFTLEGVDYVAEVHHDSDMGAPWEAHDGHGPVSDWTTRAKRPGEMILNSDRDSHRYYDFAAAVRIARAESWGHRPYPLKITADNPDRPAYTACGGWAEAGPFKAYDPNNFNRAVSAVYAQHRATMSPREYAARAALADYARLRAWCDDEWHYVGVVVRRADSCSCCGASESCWGIESDSPEWIREVAEDMAGQLSFARKAA
jgi:hypothetical protein